MTGSSKLGIDIKSYPQEAVLQQCSSTRSIDRLLLQAQRNQVHQILHRLRRLVRV